jgi:hypothetical protein
VIHNILDGRDRLSGIEIIQLVETMAKLGKLPSLDEEESEEGDLKMNKTVKTRHVHVWSAGGDGAVMSVFKLLVGNKVDLDLLFFSCNVTICSLYMLAYN